ncbi:hypothetical protein BDV95DRAFT_668100 [Massariosphaeria phaeospora]|uniref:Uncharacterized protein n=1 Tax=Massariosphaeria phaeospora TaxID=100035 RepID=A0A7C8M883_9PLEO|nr:hypothetical protein BDV95DRAFT_668100 [Massariosphaeria phaeospora]
MNRQFSFAQENEVLHVDIHVEGRFKTPAPGDGDIVDLSSSLPDFECPKDGFGNNTDGRLLGSSNVPRTNDMSTEAQEDCLTRDSETARQISVERVPEMGQPRLGRGQRSSGASHHILNGNAGADSGMFRDNYQTDMSPEGKPSRNPRRYSHHDDVAVSAETKARWEMLRVLAGVRNTSTEVTKDDTSTLDSRAASLRRSGSGLSRSLSGRRARSHDIDSERHAPGLRPLLLVKKNSIKGSTMTDRMNSSNETTTHPTLPQIKDMTSSRPLTHEIPASLRAGNHSLPFQPNPGMANSNPQSYGMSPAQFNRPPSNDTRPLPPQSRPQMPAQVMPQSHQATVQNPRSDAQAPSCRPITVHQAPSVVETHVPQNRPLQPAQQYFINPGKPQTPLGQPSPVFQQPAIQPRPAQPPPVFQQPAIQPRPAQPPLVPQHPPTQTPPLHQQEYPRPNPRPNPSQSQTQSLHPPQQSAVPPATQPDARPIQGQPLPLSHQGAQPSVPRPSAQLTQGRPLPPSHQGSLPATARLSSQPTAKPNGQQSAMPGVHPAARPVSQQPLRLSGQQAPRPSVQQPQSRPPIPQLPQSQRPNAHAPPVGTSGPQPQMPAQSQQRMSNSNSSSHRPLGELSSHSGLGNTLPVVHLPRQQPHHVPVSVPHASTPQHATLPRQQQQQQPQQGPVTHTAIAQHVIPLRLSQRQYPIPQHRHPQQEEQQQHRPQQPQQPQHAQQYQSQVAPPVPAPPALPSQIRPSSPLRRRHTTATYPRSTPPPPTFLPPQPHRPINPTDSDAPTNINPILPPTDIPSTSSKIHNEAPLFDPATDISRPDSASNHTALTPSASMATEPTRDVALTPARLLEILGEGRIPEELYEEGTEAQASLTTLMMYGMMWFMEFYYPVGADGKEEKLRSMLPFEEWCERRGLAL